MMDQVEEIKSKVDLVEIVSSYIPLKRTGRNFAALCPFHSEKTPSFMISGERQVFKCFGCNESGDVFTFLEKIEGWDFREALEEMAKKTGVTLKSVGYSGRSQTKEKIVAINKVAAKFYAYLLMEHKLGEKARKYLGGRGIKRAMWQKFGLGYAPSGWDNTLKFLTKRGYELSDVAMAGLILASQAISRGYYDRFRDRLIFPLKDSRGSVLGFSARTIEPETRNQKLETRREPKYINTPETPIFNKGSLLFGLDLSREAIRKMNEAILVEGEFDVISAHQIGLANTVASKGTALTEKQAALLGRLCENVIVAFDTDLAGDTAARRGIELLDLGGLNIKVVQLGANKDPDTFVQKDPSGFKKTIKAAVNVYDYLAESAAARHDAKTVEGKKRIGGELVPILAKISNEIVRAHYVDKLSKILDIDVSLVASAVEKKAGTIYVDFEQSKDQVSTSGRINLEEYFLALFIFQDEVEKGLPSLVTPADFGQEKARSFWRWLCDRIKTSKTKSLTELLQNVPKELGSFVDNLYLFSLNPGFSDREVWLAELTKIAERLKEASLKRKLSEISRKIKVAQQGMDRAQIAILVRKFGELSKHLKKNANA